MLKGTPNEQEEVVIGYYTLPPYWGQGYMTESIIALKDWLLHQPNAKYVIADTEKKIWLPIEFWKSRGCLV